MGSRLLSGAFKNKIIDRSKEIGAEKGVVGLAHGLKMREVIKVANRQFST